MKITPDTKVVVDDRDLDQDPIVLSDGTVLNEAAAAQFGREVADKHWRNRN